MFLNVQSSISLSLQVYKIILSEISNRIYFSWCITLVSLVLRASTVSFVVHTANLLRSSKDTYKLFGLIELNQRDLLILSILSLFLSSFVTFIEFQFSLRISIRVSMQIFKEAAFSKNYFYPSLGIHTPKSVLIRSGGVGFIRPIQCYILVVPYLLVLCSCLFFTFLLSKLVVMFSLIFLMLSFIPQLFLQKKLSKIHLGWGVTADKFANASSSNFGSDTARLSHMKDEETVRWKKFLDSSTSREFYSSQLLFRLAAIKSQYFSRSINYGVVAVVLLFFYYRLFALTTFSEQTLNLLILSLVGLAVSATTVASLITTALRFESDFVNLIRLRNVPFLFPLKQQNLKCMELLSINQTQLRYFIDVGMKTIYLDQVCNEIELKRLMHDCQVFNYVTASGLDEVLEYLQLEMRQRDQIVVLDKSLKFEVTKLLSEKEVEVFDFYYLEVYYGAERVDSDRDFEI